MPCYDHEKAEKAVSFIRLLTHTKGKWAGSPFHLMDWQLDLVRKLFGTVDADGFRVYRTCYNEIPKKNGKSELAAAIALYLLVADDEPAAEVYSAAADRKQAGIVFKCARIMVDNQSTLRERLDIVDSQKRIVDHKTYSVYEVLSSEAFSKHGLNPSGICFDELHAQPNRELYDTLVEGTDTAREQQLVFITTTAGIADIHSIGYEVHNLADQINRGIIEDPHFLPVMFGADETEDWQDPKVWTAANPSLGTIFSMDKLKKHFKEVQNVPARQNNFRRFRLNQWVKQYSRWLPMDHWAKCGGRVIKKDLIKRPCYGALDLASSKDLTAFVLLFPPEKPKEKWKVLGQFFVPKDTIVERVRADRVPYDMWARKGWITATPGNVVDHGFIKKAVINAGEIYDLREVNYDPWAATEIATTLYNDHGIIMVEHRQGYKSMSEPTKHLLKFIMGHKLCHGSNPVLTWCADNLVVTEDASENVKPAKDKARERIDGIVALIMALGGALRNMDHKSIYEESGNVIAL